MRVLVQRVRKASVTVDGTVTGTITDGMLVFVGVTVGDSSDDRDWLVHKLINLRIFDDDNGVMNKSIRETNGNILAVSQFTLYASTKKGQRPSWSTAARPEVAQPIFNAFVAALSVALGKPVETGLFGAHMHVALVNDGPVTIWLDSRTRE
ncbi:MAG TPA: D-aminoacyl-tRNA deacylase [Casimicrobiaceae bacterium]